MCEVCAAFGRGHHWTARAGSVPSHSQAVDIRSYRAERKRIVTLLNGILAPLELRIEDWDGETFMVHMRNGATAKAADLGELWQIVEKLNGAAFDPLTDPFLLSSAT